jgi:Xaa-Pro dipeptidase
VNQDIIDKCVALLDAEDVDALIALTPENFGYITGFIVPSHPILRWRHAAAVVTRDGRHALLTVDMESSTVKDLEPREDTWVWEEFADDAMPVLSELLTGLGLASARLGIETSYLPARDMEALSTLLPKASWEPAQEHFNRLRMLKTPRELELMHRLSRITDRSIKQAILGTHAGDSEMDLAGAVTSNLLREGAQNFKWLILASGDRSQFPNVGPTSRQLEHGDVVRLEVFGTLDGCRDLILDKIHGGASGAEIYQRVKDRFQALGWEPLSFVGHGIGLFAHEEPYIGRHTDAQIQAGMVLGVEPVLLLPGRYGFQVKDVVAVGPRGCQVLSDVTNTNELLIID